MRKAHAIIIGLVASLASAGQLHADPDRALGVWQGSGTVFSKRHSETLLATAEDFQREVVAFDQRSTETKGNVVLTTGAVIPIFQRTTQSEGGVGFRLESNRGKGGGYVLAVDPAALSFADVIDLIDGRRADPLGGRAGSPGSNGGKGRMHGGDQADLRMAAHDLPV